MKGIERPDLSGLPAGIVAYIETLEQQLAAVNTGQPVRQRTEANESDGLETEFPTTVQVVTGTSDGVLKRTARHHYTRQRRGGMGVFDLLTPEEAPPAVLGIADLEDEMLIVTNHGRLFKRPVGAMKAIPEPRGRGEPLSPAILFRTGEKIVAVLPVREEGFCLLLSERGFVRRVRSAYLGKSMIDGTSFHVVKEGGYLVAAAWSDGHSDLFIATRQGQAVRFNETQVPARGVLGMRIAPEDRAVGLAAVGEDASVFLVTADGKGTRRSMGGFRANRSPGAAGKAAMKTDQLVGVVAVSEDDDLLLLSRLSKIIRFSASEVPAKEGVVQGVNCFNLRADEVVTAAGFALG